VLVPPLLACAWTRTPNGRALRVARMTAVFTGAVVLLYAPVWAGAHLLQNVRENPAAVQYNNSLWENVSEAGARLLGVAATDVQHPWLDVSRKGLFAAAMGWMLWRGRRRTSLSTTMLRAWVLFVLSAAWIWPWRLGCPRIANGWHCSVFTHAGWTSRSRLCWRLPARPREPRRPSPGNWSAEACLRRSWPVKLPVRSTWPPRSRNSWPTANP